jgi:hypothetical protein
MENASVAVFDSQQSPQAARQTAVMHPGQSLLAQL